MIIIFEIDKRKRKGKRFNFKPCFFRGYWRNKKCYRIGWLIFSFSYYPEKGLRDFLEYNRFENACWHNKSTY